MALVQAIADEIGVELEIKPTDFNGVLANIQTGSVDLGIAAFVGTDERGQVMEFSDEAVTTVGQELMQDEQSSDSRNRSGGNGPLLRIGHAMEQRLLELEETVETLLQNPGWQDAQLERMERRLMLLEPTVRQIQRQLASLTQQMSDYHPADEISPEEPH